MRPGEVVNGRFEIRERAGSGGMGTVYRALDRTTGEHVALKALKGSQSFEAARFAREAKVLAALVHPRIVRYVSHGVAETSEPYLAMEWLAGEPLDLRLTRGRLSVEDCVLVAE